MRLLLKINVILIVLSVIGLALSYKIADGLLQANARSEVQGNARLLVESALAVRTYTNKQISPLLKTQSHYGFLPQRVAAYSAKEYFNNLRQKFPEYTYREATLNPTNPLDRADDWEADVVRHFRENPDAKELIGERDTALGKTLWLARPLRVLDQTCLECHSSVSAAPQSMIDLYGTANGFGWLFKDVVGAQIVSVPYAVPVQRANAALRSFVYVLVGLFLFLFVVGNILMTVLVVRPVIKLSTIADQVSLGDMGAPEFPAKSGDEIAALGLAFNRLRISLDKALSALRTLRPG
jgi:HAMP domain-containing protein